MKTKWVVIGKGQAGWHADGLSDWGSGPNKVSGSGGELESYCEEADDGCIVYDASEADYPSFVEWVISGPMMDPTLAPGTDGKFSKEHAKTLGHMMPGLGKELQAVGVMGMADLLAGKKYGSLDYVALDIWAYMFKAQVSGVKWGKVINHEVVWDN